MKRREWKDVHQQKKIIGKEGGEGTRKGRKGVNGRRRKGEFLIKGKKGTNKGKGEDSNRWEGE